MARFKHIDTSPRFLAIDLEQQLVPGTFEHALHHLLEHEIDLSHFDARFHNDLNGAAAYPPAMLLKIVLFAYSRGLVSSRNIARACREQVTFIALSGDSQPHFTTVAHFISTLGDDIAKVFAAVLAICDGQGLLGREMFAIDGIKLPSNAAKSRSGTRTDFEGQATKLEAAAQRMLARHQAEDLRDAEPMTHTKGAQRLQRLARDAAELRTWLANHPHDRRGARGSVIKSNRTDNESAKMATDKGVIQGYTGVAAVDAKHQLIVAAEAHGTGSEQALLVPVVTALKPFLQPTSLITADAGYHSKDNLLALQGSHCRINGQEAIRFQGAKRDCVPCSHRPRCLRSPAKTPTRQVAFFNDTLHTAADRLVANMRERIDSPLGRARYEQRFATVEPMFGNLRYNKRLSRFTLRGRTKVNAQWQLFCSVHNLEKLTNLRQAA